MLVATHLQQEK